MRTPNLFIVGAPKCGTSAMCHYLSKHPDVFMSPVKEPYYFATDFNDEARRNGTYFSRFRTLEAYLQLYKRATTQRYCAEGSVYYWTSRTAASQIAAFDPDARIIIMVRDPRELLPSLHAQLHFTAMEDQPDVAKALALESDRRQGRHVPPAAPFPGVLYYSEAVRFADNIRRFGDAFPPGQIRIILFDDLKKDPAAVYHDTCHWLGIDDTFTPTFERVNPNKVHRYPLLHALRKNGLVVKASRMLLPVSVRQHILKTYIPFNRKQVPRSATPPEVLDDIKVRYRDEVKTLGAMIKRDLITLWGYDR